METGRFWPICPFGARNDQICTEFLLLVKFASNFCYCAVDQEKAVFQWKRAVSGSICSCGARNGEICTRISAIVL